MAVNQFQPGMSVQQMYDNINNSALSGWSDSSKTAFMNYFNAENANQHELEMWRLNNEYNTPENQVRRLIEAGLNPAVAYDKVSSGTSSSAPGTHKADSTNFHDTKDRLDRINTIISGISSIIGSVGSAVGSIGGIQDVALKHQNNWYNALRARYGSDFLSSDGLSPEYWLSTSPDYFPKSVEVSPGLYMEAGIAQLFPEFTKGFNSNAATYELKHNADIRAQGIYDKQMQVNEALDRIFKALEDPEPNFGDIFKDLLKILAIQSLKRY